MRPRTLTDDDLAGAMLRGPGPMESGEQRSSCVDEDRFWDFARGALDAEAAATLIDHALDCPDCSLALRVARETFAASGLAPEGGGPELAPSGWWPRLAGRILNPAAALVYLVLLVLSFPLYRVMAPSIAPSAPSAANPPVQAEPATPPLGPALRGVRVLRLTGEISLRSGTTPIAPVRARLDAADVLLLKLFPETEDLPKDPGAVLLVRVLDGELVTADATRHVSDLEADQSLELLLDRERLRPGTIYTVEVATSRAESPILKQSFRLDRD